MKLGNVLHRFFIVIFSCLTYVIQYSICLTCFMFTTISTLIRVSTGWLVWLNSYVLLIVYTLKGSLCMDTMHRHVTFFTVKNIGLNAISKYCKYSFFSSSSYFVIDDAAPKIHTVTKHLLYFLTVACLTPWRLFCTYYIKIICFSCIIYDYLKCVIHIGLLFI